MRTIRIALILCAAVVAASPVSIADTPLRDIDGLDHGRIERPSGGKWSVLFFLMADCPIANRYAPEIQRICAEYGPKGARCYLVYVGRSATVVEIKKHVKDFGYRLPAIF